MFNFSWKRILTVALGVGLTVAGTVLVQPLLITAGVGVVGWAIPFAGDKAGDKTKTATSEPTK